MKKVGRTRIINYDYRLRQLRGGKLFHQNISYADNNSSHSHYINMSVVFPFTYDIKYCRKSDKQN